MKLFQHKPYYEGEGYPEEVLVSWGRKFDSGMRETVVDRSLGMVAIDRAWIPNGVYIKFELPFTFKTTYMDPTSFVYKIGKVRPVALFVRRKSGDKMTYWSSKVLKPIDPKNDPLDMKKNVDMFGPELTYSNFIGEDTAPPVIFEEAK